MLMYAAEQLLQTLSYDELYYTLRSIVDDDNYLDDFLDNQLLEDFLYMLEVYDIVFIASDDRVLLTQKGEKILQYIGQIVELTKTSAKVKKKKKL
jgi:hypothetical protein